MNILFVNDNSLNQSTINGVIITNTNIISEFKKLQHNVVELTPDNFDYKFELPFYKGLYCTIPIKSNLENYIKQFDHIHIVTEGPIGLTVRNLCCKNNISFTTAYHTKFPEYVYANYKIPASIAYKYLRWFHSKSKHIFTPTEEINNILKQNGFTQPMTAIGRGVVYIDPINQNPFEEFYTIEKYKIYLYVGRISREKNLEKFLELKCDRGVKVIVGDGPQLDEYKRKYTDCFFLGKVSHVDLSRYYSNADVCVFPSMTDTFGLTNAESLTYGTPVAMFRNNGVNSIVDNSVAGVHDNLLIAIKRAEKCDRNVCKEFAKKHFQWNNVANKMLNVIQQ